jgi:UDP-glucose 4-epimerase
VADLIDAHILALESLAAGQHKIINLGSGSGYSVAEVISAATKVLGKVNPVEITSRRSGDPAVLVADISLAGEVLKWKPKHDIEKMVSDTWESSNAKNSK